MSRPAGAARRDAAIEAIYQGLTRHAREMRSLRGMREARGGRGPTIKRGTGRSALAIYLAGEVLRALDDETWSAD